MRWAAVILTGGTGSRLGGVEKASLRRGGRTLLAVALDAVSAADEVVVVGPAAPAPPGLRFATEDPPGGGPLAGLAAGVAALSPGHERVVVLAGDMPGVTGATVARLLAAAARPGAEGAWLVDSTGRRQLAGVVSPAAVPDPRSAWGAPLRLLMDGTRAVEVQALEHEGDDVDTWEDAERLGVDPGVEPRRT